MDIAGSLEHSFQQQCHLQLERLSKDISEEEVRMSEIKKPPQPRLFPGNVYQGMTGPRRQYYEKILSYILKSLGETINNNLKAQAREANSATRSTLRNALLVVDRRRTSENFHYDKNGIIQLKSKNKVKLSGISSTRTQALILHMVAIVIKLIENGTYKTKRELYYLSLKFLRVRPNTRPSSQSQQRTQSQQLSQSQPKSQSQSQQASQSERYSSKYRARMFDAALDHICCLVGCSKVHLHILTQSKGIVFGDLVFKLKTGEVFNCLSRKQGTSIPSPNDSIVEVNSEAKFILLIEKDSVLQMIVNRDEGLKFVNTYRAILITGKGYPDINTKAFLNFIWSKLKLPVLALTDADPHGIEILCSYKYGNYTTAYEGSSVCVPHIKWLGLLPGDVKRLSIPESSLLPLSESDMIKINSLVNRPYFKDNQAFQTQLNLIIEMGRKAELEALHTDCDYFLNVYLPNKLRYASWL